MNESIWNGGIWNGEDVDLDAYLARTGLSGGLRPDLAALRAVHRAHVSAFAFENLDVMLGRPVLLDVASLQAKMVDGRRGGYCFEQNLLFGAVLERLGFRVRGLAARVRMGGTKVLPMTHMALRVEADGDQWLCDVGFGGEGLLEPLPFRDGARARQGEWTFSLADEPEGPRVLRSLHKEGWFDLYALGAEERLPIDYTVANHYISTHPRSPFVSQVVVQKTEPDVRTTLTGSVLSVVRPDGSADEWEVGEGELREVLVERFGIELADDDAVTLARVYSSRT
ncbi:arylamine N-acetyltransferase family protein [Streptomyces luteireticuli]|uniref:Arylamine N-acetyltransferase n=1 Tax=Streptomyces luteireticuli TaxID=173858 RepID=A0ABN0YV09_9ACTN